MKKVHDLIKPYVMVIFGALTLLYYLNFLQRDGAQLAIGIIALIISIYYIVMGILGICLGDKLPNKVLNPISMGLFPVFMFVLILLMLINSKEFYGPREWVIAIVSMVGYLAFAIFYPIAYLLNNKELNKLVYILVLVVILAMLLDVVFMMGGTLGGIGIALVVMYVLFTDMMLASLPGKKEVPKAE